MANSKIPNDEQLKAAVVEVTKEIEAFEQWLLSLTEEDKRNFFMLIALPNAAVTISKAPDHTFKRWANFALALKKVVKK